jgi:hypothetical protein
VACQSSIGALTSGSHIRERAGLNPKQIHRLWR